MIKSSQKQFDAFEDEWWDDKGAFSILHAMNGVRMEFILDVLHNNNIQTQNLDVLDVGCGGGILSESLARLGSKVTAIDESQTAISTANKHKQISNLKINYLCDDIKNHHKQYSFISAMELLEHVDDIEGFVKELSRLLKSNGILVASTINRNILSFLVAIIGAEYITNKVPVNTHQYNKFIKPHEIVALFEKYQLKPLLLKGLSYNFFKRNWQLSDNFNINYIIAFSKV